MTPAVSAWQLLWGILLGCLLGVVYGFLRPPGQRHRVLCDLLFSLTAVWIWLYHSFAVCRGDIRTVYLFGMIYGIFLWEKTFGRWLRPVVTGFWKILKGIFRFFLFPLKKILEFAKILFASGEKWVTIVCTKISNSQRRRKESHGRKEIPPGNCESGSSSRVQYP